MGGRDDKGKLEFSRFRVWRRQREEARMRDEKEKSRKQRGPGGGLLFLLVPLRVGPLNSPRP